MASLIYMIWKLVFGGPVPNGLPGCALLRVRCQVSLMSRVTLRSAAARRRLVRRLAVYVFPAATSWWQEEAAEEPHKEGALCCLLFWPHPSLPLMVYWFSSSCFFFSLSLTRSDAQTAGFMIKQWEEEKKSRSHFQQHLFLSNFRASFFFWREQFILWRFVYIHCLWHSFYVCEAE